MGGACKRMQSRLRMKIGHGLTRIFPAPECRKSLEINNIYKFDVWHSRPRLWFPSVNSRGRLCHIPEIV